MNARNKTSKTGDYGESSFMTEAIKRGYVVSKPFGAAEFYDIVLDNGTSLFKIQVKAANGYKKKDSKRLEYRFYDLIPIGYDFAVLFNIDTSDFYIIPKGAIENARISITGDGQNNRKWSAYKNNWNVFK